MVSSDRADWILFASILAPLLNTWGRVSFSVLYPGKAHLGHAAGTHLPREVVTCWAQGAGVCTAPCPLGLSWAGQTEQRHCSARAVVRDLQLRLHQEDTSALHGPCQRPCLEQCGLRGPAGAQGKEKYAQGCYKIDVTSRLGGRGFSLGIKTFPRLKVLTGEIRKAHFPKKAHLPKERQAARLCALGLLWRRLVIAKGQKH